jgi:osmoprotectant transport system ATP-binding protein
MRAALDAAVLSPVGIAVGVDPDGAVVGVADQAEISATIRALDDEQDSSY